MLQRFIKFGQFIASMGNGVSYLNSRSQWPLFFSLTEWLHTLCVCIALASRVYGSTVVVNNCCCYDVDVQLLMYNMYMWFQIGI
jgi:hypothetical protein